VNCVAFSPNGKRIVSGEGWFGGQGGLRVWDAESGRQLHHFKGETVWSVAFSPDGQRIATGYSSEQAVQVLAAATGQTQLALQVHRGFIINLSFSPDGRQLASSSADRTVRVWDTTSGREVRTFFGHLDMATSVAIHPAGRRLASSGDDGTVKV